MFDNIGPNVKILAAPSNWFLVAFAMAILAFIFHILNRDKTHG